jgi:hypothetical protein
MTIIWNYFVLFLLIILGVSYAWMIWKGLSGKKQNTREPKKVWAEIVALLFFIFMISHRVERIEKIQENRTQTGGKIQDQ